jgi:methyl coenzyme M reductase subunit D
MMDINKYILSQIKIDEKLLKLVEQQQEKQPTKVIKYESKQKPNSFLLDLINENIRNEKRLTNHYKSVATGKIIVEEDDNIRLITSNESLDINLENQFNFLMSKYVKDQTTLTTLRTGLLPNMLAELVHNFSYYEPQIRQYRV